MPAPCTLCHRETQAASVCQTWSDFGFHDTLLPLALGTASPSNVKGCRHVSRKSSPPTPAASSPPSPRPRVIECLVHAITSSRRRVPKPSDTFQKVLQDFDSDQEGSDCDSDSDSSSGSTGGGGGKGRDGRSAGGVGGKTNPRASTSTATAELKKTTPEGGHQAGATPKPRLIRVSRRCIVRRDVSPVEAAPSRCRYALGDNSRRRHVRWADEGGVPTDLVTVHLIRPRLRSSSATPTCFPIKSILKGAVTS